MRTDHQPTSSRTRRCLVAAMLLTGLASASLPAGSADAMSNNYPYRADTTGGSDPWGFTKRQCVSYVAWRLSQHRHPLKSATQHWGNASHWDEAARALHYVANARAAVGTVAQWNGYEKSPYYANGATRPNGTMRAGGYGHVAYVSRVWPDGSATVEQFNMNGARSYSSVHVKAPRYIYVR